MQLVTVDIGGTHARFALATVEADGSIALGEPATFHTRDHASFQTAWEDFAQRQGGTLPDAVAIAVAGPVGGEVIRFTNNPWIIRPALIPEKLGVSRYTVVNDFGAVGHAVARAGDAHFVHLAGPESGLPASGTLSIVGPGTGLGVAHVWAIQPTDDKSLWQLGLSGQDSLAAAAVDRFCLSLGAVAGDIALAQGASGVVIAGGLGLRIRDTLLRSCFYERFRAKGRFSELMGALPVKLITHPQPGLYGAAAAFAAEHLS